MGDRGKPNALFFASQHLQRLHENNVYRVHQITSLHIYAPKSRLDLAHSRYSSHLRRIGLREC